MYCVSLVYVLNLNILNLLSNLHKNPLGQLHMSSDNEPTVQIPALSSRVTVNIPVRFCKYKCFILWCSVIWTLYVLPHTHPPTRQFDTTTQKTTQVSTTVKTSILYTNYSSDHRTPVMYGPAPHPGYSYGPPKVPSFSYYPGVQFVGNVSSGGYPDRRYKLPPQFLSADPYLYTTLLQPATPYNPDDWWERQATQNTVAGHKWGHCIVAAFELILTSFVANLIWDRHISI